MQRPETRNQRSETRRQRSEDRGQRIEVRGQRSEDRGQKLNCFILSSLSSVVRLLSSVFCHPSSVFRRPSSAFCHLFFVVCLLSSVLCFLLSPCYAATLSSSELIANAKQYDGKIVVYHGEVIGDVMVRGSYAWINVNDSQNAIGIWLESKLVKDIQYTGGYTSRGDLIAITGTFHRACIEHGGDLDIHAKSTAIYKKGSKLEEKSSPFKIKVAIYLLIICLTLTVIYFITLGYRKKK
ncbi:MAG: hypothetical protein WCI77_04740 [Candidatus Omnitrophota bacterium]